MDISDNFKKEFSKTQKKYHLHNILWKSVINQKIEKKHYNKIKIGLFNVPCGGFGDIIVTKTFHDYLKEWYPGSNISICTTGPKKYSDLGLKNTKIYQLVRKDRSNLDDGECSAYEDLKLVENITFDIIIVIPIINYVFNHKKFKKLIPYSNVFNTFSVSEYNGEYPPYTFPIGIGNGQLGLLLNKFPIKQQKIIKKPYGLVYIQPSPAWGVHSKYCFLSYLEMVCKNYSKEHPGFQIIIPKWIYETLNENYNFMLDTKKIIKQYYDNFLIVTPDGEEYSLQEGEKRTKIVLRADILPQKREIFISLMKDSIKDILVTGDQSLTDIISCCKANKRIWYQIAPWKSGLAENMTKHLPNKYYDTFKTSCGTIKSINTNIDWSKFMKDYDFRKKGKVIIDAILIGNELYQNNSLYQNIAEFIMKSRDIKTAKIKIKKLFNNKSKKSKSLKKRINKSKKSKLTRKR